MKKFDIKKVGIILAIVVVAVLGIFLIGKAIKGGSVDDQQLEQYENYTLNYYLNLTAGINTSYGGLDALYAADETKLENLSDRHLIHASIDYITKEGIMTSYDYATVTTLYKDTYPEIDKSAIYKGEEIRKGIKALFGIENFANPSIAADETYTINYVYIAEEDLYMVYEDNTYSTKDEKQSIDYSLIETTTKKDKIITTIAIAYRYQKEDTYTYASDRLGENVISENAKEFPKDKIDQFDKYEFTLSKTKDGKNYIFESVKKVK